MKPSPQPPRIPFLPILSILLLAVLPWAAPASAQEGAGLPERADPDDPISRLPSLPVDQVERGQTGYGLTVFNGTEPERFEVEVIGVLRNTDPQASYVLARLTGHGLEESGVAQGMSGSPVFIDGKLVGAVAFAWPYAKEAIAGITPIDAMRSMAELPSGIDREPIPLALSGAGSPFEGLDALALATGEVPEGLLEAALATLRPRASAATPGAAPAIGWVSSGFGEEGRALLQSGLATAAATGGRTDRGAPLVPGGPVAAVLIDGDLQLAATGTVTERSGSEVLAFGHPFLGLGPLWLPMASAEILTVLPSNYNSFKISNLGPVVGAFEQDTQTGIRGRLGADAPMIPFRLKVRGVRDADFEMRIAAVPQLVPALLAAATVGAVDSATFTNGPYAVDLEATFHLKDWGELPVRQSFDGQNAANHAANHLVAFAGFVTNNPLERVEIESVEATLTQTVRPRTATLVGAHAERTVVHPGDRVRLNLTFKGYQGATSRRAVEVEVPEEMPEGRLSMLVGDGESADAARMQIEPAAPVTFRQALDLLRTYHSKRELVVLQVFRGSGLSVAGSTLPRLPGSIHSIWDAAASGGAQELRMAVEEVVVEELPFPADGIVRIDLEVRRRQPLMAAAGEDGSTSEAVPVAPEGAGEGGPSGESGESAEVPGGDSEAGGSSAGESGEGENRGEGER
jgi:hypothetical protein